jgi:dynein heavy chain
MDQVRKESRGPGAAAACLGNTHIGASRAGISRFAGAREGATGSQGRHGIQKKADGEALEALGFPKEIGYGQRAALKKECGRFVRFSYLADLLTTQALLDMSGGSLSDVVVGVSPPRRPVSQKKSISSLTASRLIAAMSPTRRKWKGATKSAASMEMEGASKLTTEDALGKQAHAPIFKVDAEIAEDGEVSYVNVTPGASAFQDGVIKSIDDGCQLMEVFYPLAAHRDLLPYRNVLDPLQADSQPHRPLDPEEGQDTRQPQSLMSFLEHLVLQKAWKDSVGDLDSALREAFSEAVAKLGFFDQHVENCRECLRTDIAKKVEDSLEAGSVEGLGALLDQYDKEVSELQSLPSNIALYVLDIDITNVKAELLKGPTKCRSHLHTLLPEIVSQRSTSLSAWIKACKHELANEADNIDMFVQQVCSLQATGLEIQSRTQELTCIQNLCGLIDTHKIEMVGPVRKQAMGVSRDFGDFRQWIVVKQDELSQLKPRFAGELQQLEEALDKDIAQLLEEVCEESFLVLKTDIGIFSPGCASPAQALVDDGKIPALLVNDKLVKDTVLEADVEEKATRLQSLCDAHKRLCSTQTLHNRYHQMLGQDPNPIPALDDVRNELEHRLELWEAMHRWQTDSATWLTATLSHTDTKDLTREVATLWEKVREAQGVLPPNPVFNHLRAHIMLIRDAIPSLFALQNPHMRDRHARSVAEALQAHLDSGLSSLLVGTLVELGISKKTSDIQSISARATQEQLIEVQLESLSGTWAEIEFSVVQYRVEQKDSYVLGPTEDISAQLDDSLVTVNAILNSRVVQVHLETARSWQQRLEVAQTTLQEWLLCQQKWKYLERIFVVSDIQKQLIRESNTFQAVDASWKQIMLDTHGNPGVLHACSTPGLCESFQQHHRTLDKIERELNDYLDTKRMAFPRLYFLSNEELLTITAHGREQKMIELYTRKCFSGFRRLDFGDDRSTDILAGFSEEGERLNLGGSRCGLMLKRHSTPCRRVCFTFFAAVSTPPWKML